MDCYVDAAFAPHDNSKSHMGVVVFIGGAMLYDESRKQKCVTKLPTESELVALTDNVGFAESFAEFFAFIVNEEVQTPVVFQDSTVIISLVTKRGEIARTKHLHARMNLCK